VIYKEKHKERRRYRVVDLLESMFTNNHGLILSTPFIFKGGVTKSSILVEVSQATQPICTTTALKDSLRVC
jgi:hypothetical protein